MTCPSDVNESIKIDKGLRIEGYCMFYQHPNDFEHDHVITQSEYF